ncbi:unnamed protein product [Pieris macdunnoughi]|uniref:Uncharacterized protein n=1 Tax=Pieris macdunnoughi TaxID=345717 RepID=A0A821R4L3_9NEOP|nr:unnamed protein product [Pieris macdunnoughi]
MPFGFLLVTCLIAFGTYWATKYALMEGSFFGNTTSSAITTTTTTPKYDEEGGYDGSGDVKDDFGSGSGGNELKVVNEGSGNVIDTITPEVRVGTPRLESGLAPVRTTVPPENVTSRRILDIFEDESMLLPPM